MPLYRVRRYRRPDRWILPLLFILALLAAWLLVSPPAFPQEYSLLDRVVSIFSTLNLQKPNDFTFEVADAKAWEHYRVIYSLETCCAFSSVDSHKVILRGEWARKAKDSEIKRVLAHEVAHKICNCADERLTEFWAGKLLKKRNGIPPEVPTLKRPL